MTPYIKEARRLLRLAERDYGSFAILADHPDGDPAAACFHAQQGVEKALKAVLTLNQIDFPRTHNLEALADLLVDQGVDLPVPTRDLRRLNPYAVDFRYDDQFSHLVTPQEAASLARLTIDWANTLILSP